MSIEKLENLLKSGENRGLEKLIQRARNMDSLTTALRAGLPAELAENLVAANLHDDGQLVLLCTSSAWASRIRFEADTILERARGASVDAKTCVVKVCR